MHLYLKKYLLNPQWVQQQKARKESIKACFARFRNGERPDLNLMEETGLSRATVYRYFDKFKTDPDPQHWI